MGGRLAWLAISCLVLACGGRSRVVGDDGAYGSGDDDDDSIVGSGGATPGGDCWAPGGAMLVRPEFATLPTLMLALDASRGATLPAPEGGSIWDSTALAVQAAANDLPDGVPLGVTSFPDIQLPGGDTQCFGGERVQPRPLDDEQRLQIGLVMSELVAQPDGVLALEHAVAQGSYLIEQEAPQGKQALLLVTTGLPNANGNCDSIPPMPTPTQLPSLYQSVFHATAQGIDVYFAGSYGSEAAREVLTDLAIQAGTAPRNCGLPGVNCYFDESFTTDLTASMTYVFEQTFWSEAARAGCDVTFPDGWLKEALSEFSVSLQTDAGTVALPPSPDCDSGFGEQLATDGSLGIAGGNLCHDACLAYLRDPTARIVVHCEQQPPPP